MKRGPIARLDALLIPLAIYLAIRLLLELA